MQIKHIFLLFFRYFLGEIFICFISLISIVATKAYMHNNIYIQVINIKFQSNNLNLVFHLQYSNKSNLRLSPLCPFVRNARNKYLLADIFYTMNRTIYINLSRSPRLFVVISNKLNLTVIQVLRCFFVPDANFRMRIGANLIGEIK